MPVTLFGLSSSSAQYCRVVLFADEFHIGGDELFLIRSQTMSRGDEPIANRDLEMAAVETSLIYICIYI